MNWLHLSDLHFDPKNTGTTDEIIRMLMEYIRKKIANVDYLFITGDFRFAPQNTRAQEVINLIKEIAEISGIKDIDSSVFMVPGNHDLNRENKFRSDRLSTIFKDYSEYVKDSISGEFNFSKKAKPLAEDFIFFKEVIDGLYTKEKADEIWENTINNIHYSIELPNFNLLLINTALTSGNRDESEEGKLLICHQYVQQALRSINNNNPILVLAHHQIDWLRPSDKQQLISYFSNYNVKAYICGHAHDTSYFSLNGIYYYSIGSLQQYRNVHISFAKGEMESGTVNVDFYDWQNYCWDINPHYGISGSIEKAKYYSNFSDVERKGFFLEYNTLTMVFIYGGRIIDKLMQVFKDRANKGSELTVVMPDLRKKEVMETLDLRFHRDPNDNYTFNKISDKIFEMSIYDKIEIYLFPEPLQSSYYLKNGTSCVMSFFHHKPIQKDSEGKAVNRFTVPAIKGEKGDDLFNYVESEVSTIIEQSVKVDDKVIIEIKELRSSINNPKDKE